MLTCIYWLIFIAIALVALAIYVMVAITRQGQRAGRKAKDSADGGNGKSPQPGNGP